MVIQVILVTGIRLPTSGSLPDSQLSAELPMPEDHDDDQEECDDDAITYLSQNEGTENVYKGDLIASGSSSWQPSSSSSSS